MQHALSLKQPWAALLISGLKTVEVRKWPTARRGPFLIHAARISDSRAEAWRWVTDEIRPLTEFVGGIIGQATLTDCLTYTESKKFSDEIDRHLNDPSWFQSPLYGFVFTEPKIMPFRRFAGNIRFFRVTDAEAET